MGFGARTIELDTQVDPLYVTGDDGMLFETAGQSLAGHGEALRMEVPCQEGGLGSALAVVSKELRAIEAASGVGPVAFVSVPFTNSRAVLSIVPEVLVRQDGTGTATVTSVGDLLPPTRFDAAPSFDIPHCFTVQPSRAPKEWCDAVEEAVRRLRRNELEKVVLAREVIVEADAPLSQAAALRQLRRTYPGAFRFAIDGFVGASPELLVERFDLEVHALPLAGTLPRCSDPAADEALRTSLLRSAKDRSEHCYLADMVAETLGPFCRELNIAAVPDILSLANVHHLATPVRGTLASPTINVLELVAALHPTPAVGGRPTDKALEVIAELEDLDRGRYAGAVGWVDADGNGRFAVAIRCAQLEGNRARLYAGNGILAASHPLRELEETQWKLQAMLPALVRP